MQAASNKLPCKVDLDAIVFDGDRDLRRELHADPVFAEIVSEVAGAERVASARRDLLRNALRLTEKIAPELFAAVGQAQEVLGLDTPLELFCIPGSEINAFVCPPEDSRVLIGVSSGALENLDQGELAFVVGHELGHALFDHFSMEPELLAADERIAPVHVARLYAWLRYAELSADRVGLLCCGNPAVAVRAFFKITSGLTQARFLANAEEAASQYSLISASKLESDAGDWFATHPYSPLRLRAIDMFGRSQTFNQLRGASGGDLSEADLEREVRGIMALMDPSFLDDKSPCTAEVREFLALGGLAIALIDDDFDPSEAEALADLCGDSGVLADASQLIERSPEQHQARLEQLAEILVLKLSTLQRQKIIEDLVAIALADREIFEEEVNVLSFAAGLLGVDPLFVENVLGRLESALD